MKRAYYETPKASKLMRFFWKAAGGDRYLLERATYSDQIKYMCLGGIIVATGAMAALAGGYAFYTIFSAKGDALDSIILKSHNWDSLKSLSEDAIQKMKNEKTNFLDFPAAIMSIFFGIVWGLIIFNIDRFIVTSTGKGDGTEKITKDELVGALPRILMGTIIALTISKPVEIRMFKTEIDIELHKKQINKQQEYKANIDSVYNSEIKNKEKVIQRFLSRLNQLDSMSTVLKSEVAYQIKNGGCKDKCEENKKLLASNQSEADDIKNDIDFKKVKTELDKIEKERESKLSESAKIAAGLDGLLERIKISDEIAPWISLFVTLLFLAIELTPIFFKLMLTKTTYDYIAENRDDMIKADYGIEVQYDYYKDKQGIERHLVIYHDAERLIYEKIKTTDIQKELTDYALTKYKEKEQKKIDENLDEYIKNINPNDSTNNE